MGDSLVYINPYLLLRHFNEPENKKKPKSLNRQNKRYWALKWRDHFPKKTYQMNIPSSTVARVEIV